MSEKPGVMIYFELLETVRRLTDVQAGILFRAILEYGVTRLQPNLPDELNIIWPLIQMRLDTDDERYYKVTQKRRYAIYARWAKQRDEEVLPFERWLMEYDRILEEDELLS